MKVSGKMPKEGAGLSSGILLILTPGCWTEPLLPPGGLAIAWPAWENRNWPSSLMLIWGGIEILGCSTKPTWWNGSKFVGAGWPDMPRYFKAFLDRDSFRRTFLALSFWNQTLMTLKGSPISADMLLTEALLGKGSLVKTFLKMARCAREMLVRFRRDFWYAAEPGSSWPTCAS